MFLVRLNNALIHFADDHPIMTGIVTPIATVLLSFVSDLEVGLRIAGLVLGILAAALTVYAKWLHVRKLKNTEEDD